MAGRDIRRKPGMTVGQRMRDFSRTVMRHYAPAMDDAIPSPAPASQPANSVPSTNSPVESPEANPQFVASPPLPFDAPLPEQGAPFLPPADLPVYAPDPPLPQYVVPSTPPAPVVQRSEQPARPPGDIALGPDGRPLLHNGKPIPVDHDPTPPALLELMQRQRQRDAEVQRLKEERTEKLKAELPPVPEDSDAPRSSRIRRRGSAEVDYVQTKALADKREPGDNGAPPAKNNKSPREPENQEAQPLDEDDESNGDGIDSPPFEAPTDSASSVTSSTDITTATDAPAVQRVPDTETPIPSLPFDAPVEMPLAQPVSMPDVSQPPQPFVEPSSPAPTDAPQTPAMAIQRQPDRQASATSQRVDVGSTERSAPTPAERPAMQEIPQSADEPKVSAQPVQRQADPVSSEPPAPASELNPAPRDGHPTAASPSKGGTPQISHATAEQMSPPAIQRQAVPEMTPSLPLDVPADRPGLPDEPQAPVMPAPEMPFVQREPDHEVPAPSLPFDTPIVEQPRMPDAARPLIDGPSELPLPPVAASPSLSPTIQRQPETDGFTPQLPFDAPLTDKAVFPASDQPHSGALPDAAQLPVNAIPQAPVQRVQRRADDEVPSLPATETPSVQFPARAIESSPASETAQPQRVTAPENSDSAADSSAPVVQRQPGVDDSVADALPFDVPSVEQAASPEFTQPQAPAPIDSPLSRSVPAIQRQPEAEVFTPGALPFDVPSVEQAASPAVEQPSPTTAPQVPAPIDAPLSPSVPAIQRQPDASAPVSDALPFDAPSVDRTASPEFLRPEQMAAPQSPTAIDAPLSQSVPAVQRQPEIEASTRVALPFEESPLEQAPVADVAQPQLDVSPPHELSAPSIQREAELEAPAPSAIPFDTPPVMRAPSLDPSQTAETVAPAARQEPKVSIQRQTEIELPALNALPFDATLEPQESSLDGPPLARSTSQETPVRIDVLPSQAAPSTQRQTEATEPTSHELPFDERPSAQETPYEGNQSQTDTVAIQQTSLPMAQRQSAADAPAANGLPFDAPEQPAIQPAAQSTTEISQTQLAGTAQPSPIAAAVQREANAEISAPEDHTPASDTQRQTERGVPPQVLPFDAPQERQDAASASSPSEPMNISDAAPQTAPPTIQRYGSESPVLPLPFEIAQPQTPESAPVERASGANTPAIAPVTAAPAIQRQAEVEATTSSPLPFDQPRSAEQVTESRVEQPTLPDVPAAGQASIANTAADAKVTAAPAIQRQVEVSAASSPLAFNTQPSERFTAAQTHETASPEIPELAQASSSQIVSTPETLREVHRQINAETPLLHFDRHAAQTTDEPAQVSAVEQAAIPAALPFLSHAAATPAVQRQADISMPASAAKTQTTAPAALPFDDLNAIAIQRTPVEHVSQTTLPAILPFDPVAQGDSPDIQRTTEPEPGNPFSTPGTMPAGVPATDRMDVFQALVAAGMVSRPTGGNAMPAAASRTQPLLQRSPSREAYLANMAQRQESAGAVSGPIQRALSEESESSSPAPDSENHEAPEIDINQLASDVMRVLRGKLRSEHERLSKR